MSTILPTITSSAAYAYIPSQGETRAAQKNGQDEQAPTQASTGVGTEKQGNAAADSNHIGNTTSGSSSANADNTVGNSAQSQQNSDEKTGASSTGETASESQKIERVLAQLQQADREVRAHEQAHMAAGGVLTGGASYTFRTGPDGKRYAVAGEVSINTSEGRTPEETVRRAQTIKAAAMAPAQPSSQDFAVARAANAMMQRAQSEIASKNIEKATQAFANGAAGEAKSTAKNSAANASEGSQAANGDNSDNSDNSDNGNQASAGGVGAASATMNTRSRMAVAAYQGQEGFGGHTLSAATDSAAAENRAFRAVA